MRSWQALEMDATDSMIPAFADLDEKFIPGIERCTCQQSHRSIGRIAWIILCHLTWIRVNAEQHAAIEVLQEIRSQRPLWVLRFSGPKTSESIHLAFQTLSEGNPRELLPLIARFVLSGHPVIRKEASELLLKFAINLPVMAWPKADEEIRKNGGLPYGHSSESNDDPAWIIVSACHPNGVVREKAIDRVHVVPPMIGACLLLLRVNDWVLPVRNKARDAFARALGLLDSSQRMALLPLIERLRECGRLADIEMVDQWVAIVSGSFDEASWLHAWSNCLPREKRIYVNLIKASSRLPSSLVRDAILGSNDRFALLWLIRQVLPYLDEEARDASVDLIARSRAMPVRREWLMFLLDSSPEKAVDPLKQILCDSSSSLRSFARFYLSRLAPMDFASHYVQLLHDPDLESLALISLSEVSPDQAHAQAIPRLDSPVAKVRKAAILALDGKSLDGHMNFLLEQAISSMPGVSGAARKRLSQIPGLHAHFNAHWDDFLKFPPSLQNYLAVIAMNSGKWTSLEFLLRCSPVLQEDIDVNKLIHNWLREMNRSFTGLSRTQRDHLAMLAAAARIKESLREAILFVLKKS